ncbi:unnamed protein product [Colias eurytheme]|nr:unnamed protein product [Colias eurytheme]
MQHRTVCIRPTARRSLDLRAPVAKHGLAFSHRATCYIPLWITSISRLLVGQKPQNRAVIYTVNVRQSDTEFAKSICIEDCIFRGKKQSKRNHNVREMPCITIVRTL